MPMPTDEEIASMTEPKPDEQYEANRFIGAAKIDMMPRIVMSQTAADVKARQWLLSQLSPIEELFERVNQLEAVVLDLSERVRKLEAFP